MVIQDNVCFLCSTLTQRSVSQPCVGQVLGDSFAEIESLGMPEHFCEDELLFILNSDKRWGQHHAHSQTPAFGQSLMWLHIYFVNSMGLLWPRDLLLCCSVGLNVSLLCFASLIRKSLTLKYYAKKILYFLRQQNILKSLKSFLEQPAEQQSALEGVACIQTFS